MEGALVRLSWARRVGLAELVEFVEFVELVTGQGAMSPSVPWSLVPWGRWFLGVLGVVGSVGVIKTRAYSTGRFGYESG